MFKKFVISLLTLGLLLVFNYQSTSSSEESNIPTIQELPFEH
ncbi:hypothetical protein J2Z40_002133 [Cytobacillus eiseniae]|uniref:Phosphatase n=1 Tax=Cytobacillus eiseniae TaxID=762947 RepID=A0ABS4RFA0_9BACI|nr:hypothetical protein [Cytobacillus eiseniae]